MLSNSPTHSIRRRHDVRCDEAQEIADRTYSLSLGATRSYGIGIHPASVLPGELIL